jgi:glycosyltransferase involved in cell wall biosynthesis
MDREFCKISIIIVTYNAAEYLQKCLDSIYKQKYPAIEIIIKDGGSTDDTISIIEANKERITFFKSERDNGIYDAMNVALDYASGDWIYFIGADDILFDEFSDLAFELSDLSVIYYGSVLKEDVKYLGEVTAYQHAKTTICHQAIIYPAKVFKKYRFNTKYKISSDHVLNMWCWKDKDFKFEFKDYVIAMFNHTGISSIKKDDYFEANKSMLIRENYGVRIWLRFVFKRLKALILPQKKY